MRTIKGSSIYRSWSTVLKVKFLEVTTVRGLQLEDRRMQDKYKKTQSGKSRMKHHLSEKMGISGGSNWLARCFWSSVLTQDLLTSGFSVSTSLFTYFKWSTVQCEENRKTYRILKYKMIFILRTILFFQNKDCDT